MILVLFRRECLAKRFKKTRIIFAPLGNMEGSKRGITTNQKVSLAGKEQGIEEFARDLCVFVRVEKFSQRTVCRERR